MKKDSNKGDTMKFQYVITTQNLEEYGENFHKFKGGSTYVVGATLSKEIFEKDAYGEGIHDYYEVPSVSEASVAAEVMKHVNRYNGLSGSFDYITDIDKVYLHTEEDVDFEGTFEELCKENAETIEVNYNKVEPDFTP